MNYTYHDGAAPPIPIGLHPHNHHHHPTTSATSTNSSSRTSNLPSSVARLQALDHHIDDQTHHPIYANSTSLSRRSYRMTPQRHQPHSPPRPISTPYTTTPPSVKTASPQQSSPQQLPVRRNGRNSRKVTPTSPKQKSPPKRIGTPVPNSVKHTTQLSNMEHQSHASKEEIQALFQRCREDDWHGILQVIQGNPYIALEPMTMDNHITTTVLHQAITSKADTAIRAEVISAILFATPEAAAMKNGYGSMPLHVIAQRNVKMDAQTKERLIFELVHSYKDALIHPGGVGGRTPLHIVFTDYISPKLTKMMIENGPDACFMKDKKGFLPAHVACMRHCSPEKLRMLLAIYPDALHSKTDDNETLIDLANKKATKAHPNYALIDELHKQLAGDTSHYDPIVFNTPITKQATVTANKYHQYCRDAEHISERKAAAVLVPPSHQYREKHRQFVSPIHPSPQFTYTPSPSSSEYYPNNFRHSQQPYQRQYYPLPPDPDSYSAHCQQAGNPFDYNRHCYQYGSNVGRVSSEDEDTNDAWNRSRLDSNESWISPTHHQQTNHSYPTTAQHPSYTPYQFQHDYDTAGVMNYGHESIDDGVHPAQKHSVSTPNRFVPYRMYNGATAPVLNYPTQSPHKRPSTSVETGATPSRKRKIKSSLEVPLNKSEEPAAKLLLHFSRNLHSTADDMSNEDNILDDNNGFNRSYHNHHNDAYNEEEQYKFTSKNYSPRCGDSTGRVNHNGFSEETKESSLLSSPVVPMDISTLPNATTSNRIAEV